MNSRDDHKKNPGQNISDQKKKDPDTTIDSHHYRELIEPAMAWYENHHRDLPWRQNQDPYRIWISEIMLQQTRVEAVIPYYERFLTALPTIQDLANCPEDQLLKLWEGLGYYSRVRNLKKAAEVILRDYDGKMPADHDAILSLPGIGPYTAGAISSIAFGLPYSAVDGNALRILTRARLDDRNIAEEKTKKAITKELDQDLQALTAYISSPGIFNQAMMEIGATVCLPNAAPKCQECPWNTMCMGYISNRMMEFPVKTKAKARRIEKRSILLIRDGERVLLHKRPDKGLLAGLYEFPSLDGHVEPNIALDYVKQMGLEPLRIEESIPAKHIFSHIEWRMKSYIVHVAQVTEDIIEAPAESKQGAKSYLLAELHEAKETYAIPSAFQKYTELLWGGKKRGKRKK